MGDRPSAQPAGAPASLSGSRCPPSGTGPRDSNLHRRESIERCTGGLLLEEAPLPAPALHEGTEKRPAKRGEPAPEGTATLRAVRILGVDLGHKRIGLAVTDEDGTIAFPAGALDSRGRKKDLARLRALIDERGIERAVVGLPLHLDGRRGPEAEKAVAFAAELAKIAGIPVDTLDERWTSKEAERLLQPTTAKKRDKRRAKGTVDEMAASILLQTYLAQQPGAAGGTEA
ncbi:MAG: Holliday junction resolvase RuvX [Deltaproteobacteria bacterium]|nr:Holliday junction resolvase RuvX [Deltaproteobacteria bacterium]